MENPFEKIIEIEYPYTPADLMARFGITSVRLFQFRNGPDRAKQLLFENEDFIYDKTKIKYSQSAVDKLVFYYEKKPLMELMASDIEIKRPYKHYPKEKKGVGHIESTNEITTSL